MTPRRAAVLILMASLALTACGRRAQLAYPAGTPGPATPAGAAQPPTAEQQTTPSAQAEPTRSDELLKQSDERTPDPFDLPPAGR